jgi:trimethylamine--corrinoid protein Co-methyltransferase
MLETGLCQSLEKLVIDHEICAMAQRLIKGIECSQETLAHDIIEKVGFDGNFLAEAHTLKWLSKEHRFASPIIDKDPREAFEQKGARDTYKRAKQVVLQTLNESESCQMSGDKKCELEKIISSECKRHGLDKIPVLKV